MMIFKRHLIRIYILMIILISLIKYSYNIFVLLINMMIKVIMVIFI